MTPDHVLRSYYGFSEFRGPQKTIISHVLGGKHALVLMPTGMGKSLCFQIPALLQPANHRKLTLVLSPLVALMKDQVDALCIRGIDAAYVNSSLNREERLKRHEQIRSGDFQLLYVTPERFRKQDFCEALATRQIELLAVDEAHCVSQWGHDFRPDYTRLADIRERLGNPTTIALTATATTDCQRDIINQLGLTEEVVTIFREGIDRPNLSLEVRHTISDEEKLDAILELHLNAQHHSESFDHRASQGPASGSQIIYFALIRTLERFSDLLREKRVPHVCYHGDLSREQRKRIQEKFMQDKIPLVLATNAFGMGIDKENIRQVTHGELPSSVESYYQEVGRAGRDGLPSRCTLLYDQRDLMIQMQFIDWQNPDAAYYDRLWHLLTTRSDECFGYGFEWMNKQLQSLSRHDQRLTTAIAQLDRLGVIAGPRPPECLRVVGDLPEQLLDDAFLGQKKRRDQMRLHALLEYVRTEDDRKGFLNRYFGIDR